MDVKGIGRASEDVSIWGELAGGGEKKKTRWKLIHRYRWEIDIKAAKRIRCERTKGFKRVYAERCSMIAGDDEKYKRHYLLLFQRLTPRFRTGLGVGKPLVEISNRVPLLFDLL